MSNINDILKSAKKQSLYTEFDSLVSSGEVYTKYMYIAREKKTNVFKIGHTNNLLTRLRCMNTFSYNGFKYLATVKFTGDTYGLERRVKHSFAKLDVNHGQGTEMFKLKGTDKELAKLFITMVEKNMKQLFKKYGTKRARKEAMNQVKFGQVQQLSLLK
jgi:hypothetical protein